MKKKRKAWFTLIEIIIVVIIIWILMLMGFGFNSSQLKSLKTNTITEQIKSDFDAFFLQILNSSSYQGNRYDQATLTLTQSSDWTSQQTEPITYDFSTSNQDTNEKTQNQEKSQTSTSFFTQTSDFQLTKLTLDDRETQAITLNFKPYDLSCSRAGEAPDQAENHAIAFALQPRGGKEACFALQTSYCRIQSIPCKTLSQK